MVAIVETYSTLLKEFWLFLTDWQNHLPSTALALTVWIGIVIYLFKSGHATKSKNGNSDDIGCGDIRVWRYFVIFGGPAGLTFGLPYYFLMSILNFSGSFAEYWTGFIYVQFATSVAQTVLLLIYALFGKRNDDTYRLFKSHLKGCGWVSALSPVGWIAFIVQQLLPNKAKKYVWRLRDIETILAFVFGIVAFTTPAICLAATLLNQRVIVPALTWVDQDHEHDEDSD